MLFVILAIIMLFYWHTVFGVENILAKIVLIGIGLLIPAGVEVLGVYLLGWVVHRLFFKTT